MYAMRDACVDFASETRPRDIPTEALDSAKQFLLDWLGCALYGSTRPSCAPLLAYVDLMGGAEQASRIGRPGLVSVEQAAFVNGALGHLLEMDDLDRESISHPATVVIPAALAAAEYRRSGGETLLAAVVAGYEVMLRVGAAMTPEHYRVFHTTATAGTFGAAVAAATVLGLDRERIGWAFGHAGTMAAGLWQFMRDGVPEAKILHPGRSAAAGIMAAFLAREGLVGPAGILEGEQGFFAGYARQAADPAVFADFGRRWRITGVSFKPYPSCRHTHPAIDCGLRLRRELGGDTAAVTGIDLETYSSAVQVAGNPDPATAGQSKFSIPFCLALGLTRGVPRDRDFGATCLNDPEIRRLMGLTRVSVAEDLDRLAPASWPTRVRLALADGRTLEAFVRDPKGDPENPLNWDDLAAKFRLLSEDILTPDQAGEIVTLCRTMETCPDCSELPRRLNAFAVQ